MKSGLQEKILSLAKADLHLHLNGAIPQETVKELISGQGIQLPHGFDLEHDLQVLNPVGSLREYFKPWLLLKQLPIGRKCLESMIKSTFVQLRADNIKYAEIRNSPFNISNINNITLEESLEWMLEIIDYYSIRFGLDARLILSVSRHDFSIEKASQLFTAIRKTNYNNLIVGMDITGDEDMPIPQETSIIFLRAKDELGLGITIHAGETGNERNVFWAIEECAADRIGHGLAASKFPKLLELICERNIRIEVCLTSNLRTGCVDYIEKHPVNVFLEWGVPFVLCSDNPSIHSSSLSDEYLLFVETFGRMDVIENMYQTQRLYAFGGN